MTAPGFPLAPEEVVLSQFRGKLTLTSHRVRHSFKEQGTDRIASITLESVRSCRLASRREPVLLGASLFLTGYWFATTLLGGESEPGSELGSELGSWSWLGLACLAAWLFYRKHYLEVSWGTGSIQLGTRGVSKEAQKFIDQVELAKLAMLGRQGR